MTRAALTALLLALLVAAPAVAQVQGKADALDIEDEVMCVSCNVPLFIAESPQADRQRALIRDYVDQGLTKDEIKTRLVAEYGEDVLAMPEDDGTGLAVKVVPIVAVALLLLGLAFLIPRWRARTPGGSMRASAAGAGPGPTATDAELQRVDDDVKRLG